MNFIVRMILSASAVILSSFLLPGAHVDGFGTAFLVALVLAVLNAFVKPLLILITLPLTVFTLGLFVLIINTFIIILADHIVKGFSVDGFWWAFLFSFIVSLVYSILEGISRADNNPRKN